MLLCHDWKLRLGKKIKILDLILVDRPEVSKLQIVGQLFVFINDQMLGAIFQ